ncbi:Rtr1/RPAP2 family-domain-containing protein [Powellomyces hirtus]|nr:Rtr1/RPAP2 family-domain-containing protein [Powellomyces hirtus]
MATTSSRGRKKPRAVPPSATKQPTPRQQAYAASVATKAAWEKKTFEWQQRLFEGAVAESLLAEAARYLTTTDYDDVVTERVADKLCGYPLCDNAITQTKGRYRVSRKELKVYDNSELKNFCSAPCLAASDYYRAQLSDEPPYLRPPPAKATPLVEVIPATFSDSTAKELLGTSSLPITREHLVSLYVQSLLKTLPAVQQNAIVVHENTISETPTAPVQPDEYDREETAMHIEGYTAQVRKLNQQRRRKAKTANKQRKENGHLEDTRMTQDMEGVTEALAYMHVDPAESSVTALTNEVNTLTLNDDGPPNGLEQTAMNIPAILVNDQPTKTTPRARPPPNSDSPTLLMKDHVLESNPLPPFPPSPPPPSTSPSTSIVPSISATRKHERSDSPNPNQPIRAAKRKTPQLTLSLFGQTFTTLGRLITQRTKTYLRDPTAPLPPPPRPPPHLSEHQDEDEATHTRKHIFLSRIFATYASLRRDYRLQLSHLLHDDLARLVDTLALEHSGHVMPADPRVHRAITLAFVNRIAAAYDPPFVDELSTDPLRWNALLAAAQVDQHEFDALLRLFA